VGFVVDITVLCQTVLMHNLSVFSYELSILRIFQFSVPLASEICTDIASKSQNIIIVLKCCLSFGINFINIIGIFHPQLIKSDAINPLKILGVIIH
jgi:hypothetical protein